MQARRFLLLFFLLTSFLLGGTASGAPAPHLKSKTRLEIVWGRICFFAPEGRLGGVNLRSLGASQVQFQMTRDVAGLANISYRFRSSREAGILETHGGFSVCEFWADFESEKYTLLLQSSGTSHLQFEIGTLTEEMRRQLAAPIGTKVDWESLHGSNAQSWNVSSFWELLFFTPPEAVSALQTLMEKNTGSAQILQNLRETFIEAVLRARLSVMEGVSDLSRARIHELLEQMASDDFSTRRLADQEIRRMGPAILFLVSDVQWDSLTPEVQFRLQKILQFIDEEMKITRDSYLWDAQLWISEPKIWPEILAWGTKEQRSIAWDVLREKFLDAETASSLNYDPALNSGEQQEKIKKIREVILTAR